MAIGLKRSKAKEAKEGALKVPPLEKPFPWTIRPFPFDTAGVTGPAPLKLQLRQRNLD